MEPVITVEGFKVLQDPEESRNLLGAYYETLGFHVVQATDISSAVKDKAQQSAQSVEGNR